MPQKIWTVGEEVLAADFNTYVQNQVVPAFPNVAARDTWASPPNGALAITTDTNRHWQRIAGAWVLNGGGARCGFGASQGGQTWTAGQTFSMTWATEQWDTDNFGNGSNIVTVPAGLDGIYVITVYVAATGSTSGTGYAQLVISGGFVGQTAMPTGAGTGVVSAVTAMAAGNTIQLQLINGHNANMTYTGLFRMQRLSA